MTWFKVDDTFHAHPKVLATDPAALGLWVVAGAWSSAHLTEGFVPDHALPRLLPDSVPLARKLVAAGLWRRVRGGHQFHDWTDYNPAASDVRAMREKRAAAGRKGGLASGKTRSNQGSKTEALASPIVEPPTRPDPTPIGGRSSYVASGSAREEPPPSRCPEHLDTPADGPCGPCGDARRARQQHDRDQAAAEARRIAEAPRCRKHRGQLAGSCGPCRSERLAREEA
ncbi:hypothetical protein O7626_39535 [Micromonospora sp. WMMD1102]|uniref:hypothetical protein n=1 Tax=Micromonospora sp. WMMD1102 TaxID=3016105 RepID=UPI00241501D0|nr:hypothetical protein [Micromonospora sp. WMMD1102]MDG4784332.1 hypothetical protein [Micromonospora sp. WMMD1102]MDG4784405.1 hypothetical protein [Micromonospora sp. WMMD1102]MDG4791909.1 hypothetical protein [Micromonospora sp. WMMD1102]